MIPWLSYWLGILRRAYAEFQTRAGRVRSKRGSKRELVEHAIDGHVGEFSLVDLERLCPGVSRDMIRRVLGELRERGGIESVGRGPRAKWRKKEGNFLE